MIDNYLLEQLVAFYKTGTLSAAAEKLLISQPALSRAMKKLEDELAVQLFDRKPNKISLTETGQLAAKEAQKLLIQQEKFVQRVQDFAKFSAKIRLASVAPAPLLLFQEQQPFLLQETLLTPDTIEASLVDNDCDLIFSNEEIQTDTLTSTYIGSEYLQVNIDRMTASFSGDEVTFADIGKLSFVTLGNLGIWQKVIDQEMPEAKFMMQESVGNFTEILNHSNLPFFSTNLVGNDNLPNRYQSYYITNESAMQDFYLVYRKEDSSRLATVILSIKEKWEAITTQQ